MDAAKQITVRDFASVGFLAILNSLGKDQFDQVVNQKIVPQIGDLLRSDTGTGSRLDDLAGRFDRMIREYPDEFAHLVLLALSIGIGFSVSQEVR